MQYFEINKISVLLESSPVHDVITIRIQVLFWPSEVTSYFDHDFKFRL